MKNKSPYKEGDVKWVVLIRGTYPHYDAEYIIQVEFTHYFNTLTHEAKVLRGDNISGGYESIPITMNPLRIDETKVFDSYTDAKKQLIKFLEHKKELKIKSIENEHQRRLNQFGDWENSPHNKDLVRESKINSICNEH